MSIELKKNNSIVKTSTDAPWYDDSLLQSQGYKLVKQGKQFYFRNLESITTSDGKKVEFNNPKIIVNTGGLVAGDATNDISNNPYEYMIWSIPDGYTVKSYRIWGSEEWSGVDAGWRQYSYNLPGASITSSSPIEYLQDNNKVHHNLAIANYNVTVTDEPDSDFPNSFDTQCKIKVNFKEGKIYVVLNNNKHTSHSKISNLEIKSYNEYLPIVEFTLSRK